MRATLAPSEIRLHGVFTESTIVEERKKGGDPPIGVDA